MPTPPVHDPRTSPRNRALLETPSTLAYLPHAFRWAFSAEIVLVVVPMGAFLGLLAPSWLAPLFLAFFGTAVLSWLLSLHARTVDGQGAPPPLTLEDMNVWRRGPRALVECVGFAFTIYVGARALFPAEGAHAFALAFGALLPPLFALAASDDGLWRALNPALVARLLRAGGVVGVLLSAFFALVVAASFAAVAAWIDTLDLAVLADLIVNWFPDPRKIAGAIVGLWLLALLVHLHGHALHHRHRIAGFAVSLAAADDAELEARKRAQAVARVADHLERASIAGDRALAERVAATPTPDGVDELFYLSDLWDELLRRKRFPAAVKVARRLVRVAAERKRVAYALEILTEAKRLSPGYEPGATVRLALARALLATGDDATFERITAAELRDLDDDAVELAYLRASWLADRKGDSAAAIAALAPLLDREHPLKERIARLHAMLVGLPGFEPGTKRL